MSRPTRTEAVASFLQQRARLDLAGLYDAGMELTVFVAKDDGVPIEGEYKGVEWQGYQDEAGNVWKPFHIPWNALTAPKYVDSPIGFDLSKHALGIGMSGWDWQQRVSRWVAFDFDGIRGHKEAHRKKLTPEELLRVQEAVSMIPWVTVRKSTSGDGLHLYVFLSPPVPTQTSKEHIALARAILGELTALTALDLNLKVDKRGGNMWVWHRKYEQSNGEGLKLIKEGEPLSTVPVNWKEHLTVVSGERNRILPAVIQSTEAERLFYEMTAARAPVPLTDEHRRLITWLREGGYAATWYPDHQMLVTHTSHLKEAHEALNLRGFFDTISSGTDGRSDINCFAHPLPDGVWSVKRYTPGTAEHQSWKQDGRAWTSCRFNEPLTLDSVCWRAGASPRAGGGYAFGSASELEKSLALLGFEAKVPVFLTGRPADLVRTKQDQLVIRIDSPKNDGVRPENGWYRGHGCWERLASVASAPVVETQELDDVIRFAITAEHEDFGWAKWTDGKWILSTQSNIRPLLKARGLSSAKIDDVLGLAQEQPYMIVNLPFEDEFPVITKRVWNRGAAKLAVQPSDSDDLQYPHWQLILEHCGKALDPIIRGHPWCQEHGIRTGADYLKCWSAVLINEPTRQLPYLFFYGPQNSGKSTFHESLGLLFESGYVRADQALISSAGFNGNLESAVLCVVEEVDLRNSRQAYNRIKDWVTAVKISIHKKGMDPYSIANTTHWVQCANDAKACAVQEGDTRITMIYVPPLPDNRLIGKDELLAACKLEASDYLAELKRTVVPKLKERVALPILDSGDKAVVAASNLNDLQLFLRAEGVFIPGQMVKFAEVHDRFHDWLRENSPGTSYLWNKNRMSRELPVEFPSGRVKGVKGSGSMVGNLWFRNDSETGAEITSQPEAGRKLLRVKDYLEPEVLAA